MAIQLATLTRNARLDAIETEVGTAPVIKMFTGAQPANCAAANSGTELFTETCPSDWMAAASGGAKALSGTWQAAAIGGGGTIAHFRLYASDGTTCKMQGTVTATGGGGDMTIDNPVVADGQTITITTFTLTDGNA
jgi:hypothetical protein